MRDPGKDPPPPNFHCWIRMVGFRGVRCPSRFGPPQIWTPRGTNPLADLDPLRVSVIEKRLQKHYRAASLQTSNLNLT